MDKQPISPANGEAAIRETGATRDAAYAPSSKLFDEYRQKSQENSRANAQPEGQASGRENPKQHVGHSRDFSKLAPSEKLFAASKSASQPQDESYAGRAYRATLESLKEHPYLYAGGAVAVLSLGAAAKMVMGGAARTEGKALGATLGREVGEVAATDGANVALKASSEKLIAKPLSGGAVAEKEAVVKQVGEIPNVVRPQGEALGGKVVSDAFKPFGDAYKGSLTELKTIPSHYTPAAGESTSQFAERIIKDRGRITGERVFPDTVEKEVKRLQALNPGLESAGLTEGKQVLVHDQSSMSALADTTMFKHVPQIGQILKRNGVPEEAVEQAFKIQQAIPPGPNRPLIGQILVDNKLATKEQVDLAFADQNALKDALKAIKKEVWN